MPNRVPITVLLKSEREKVLVEEVAHQRGQSRSTFCREAILRETLEAVEEVTESKETEEAVDAS